MKKIAQEAVKKPLLSEPVAFIFCNATTERVSAALGLPVIFSQFFHSLDFLVLLHQGKRTYRKATRSASLEKCKRMQSKAAHIAFFTGQRSDHVLKEALAIKG